MSRRMWPFSNSNIRVDLYFILWAHGFFRERVKIILELVQDSLDLVIPASLLEWLPVNQSFVGLVGTITSLMGCWAAWPKS